MLTVFVHNKLWTKYIGNCYLGLSRCALSIKRFFANKSLHLKSCKAVHIVFLQAGEWIYGTADFEKVPLTQLQLKRLLLVCCSGLYQWGCSSIITMRTQHNPVISHTGSAINSIVVVYVWGILPQYPGFKTQDI